MKYATTAVGVGDSIKYGYTGTVRVAKPETVQTYNNIRTITPYFRQSTRGTVNTVDDLGGYYNNGINGQMMSSITADQWEPLRPDIVTVHAITNDIAAGASLPTCEATATALANTILATGAIPCLATCLPRADFTGGQNTVKNGYNAWLLAGSLPAGSLVIDYTTDARLQNPNDPDWFSPDHIHPTGVNSGTDIGGGYGVMGLHAAPVVLVAMGMILRSS